MIARLQLPSDVEVNTTCAVVPQPDLSLPPCDDAYEASGWALRTLRAGEYRVRFQQRIKLAGGQVSMADDDASLVAVDVSVVPDVATLTLEAFPSAPVTTNRTANFNVTAALTSGIPCGAQCQGFMCRVSYQPGWQPCGAEGRGGRSYAAIHCIGVPIGTHTFTVAVNDTGSWPDSRSDSSVWKVVTATYVAVCVSAAEVTWQLCMTHTLHPTPDLLNTGTHGRWSTPSNHRWPRQCSLRVRLSRCTNQPPT